MIMIFKTNFQFLIIALIIIITTCITGIYILDNIDIPKIETPSWITPTPTQTPTPFPSTLNKFPIPIDPELTALYNSSNTTSWNWSYTNYTNISNWTALQK